MPEWMIPMLIEERDREEERMVKEQEKQDASM